MIEEIEIHKGEKKPQKYATQRNYMLNSTKHGNGYRITLSNF